MEPACPVVVMVWQRGHLMAAPGAPTMEAVMIVLEMAECWIGSLGAGC